MAETLCIIAAGSYFLTGLLTGIWKYAHMAHHEEARAPYYVDIAHRSSLLYAFAALLLAEFARRSVWPEMVNTWAAAATLLFFGLAILSYVLHGLLQDTDNQLRKPHRLGKYELPAVMLHGFMIMLVLAELGGFLVLFTGTLRSLL